MQLKVFNLPLTDQGTIDDSEMQYELENCQVLQVWEHFLLEERMWVIMVGYRPNHKPLHKKIKKQSVPATRKQKQQIELAQLDPDEHKLFEALRMWRIQEANRKQVGPHFILTNQQLIDLIKHRPKNIQEVRQIKGIGESKSKEFGESLLGIIHSDSH